MTDEPSFAGWDLEPNATEILRRLGVVPTPWSGGPLENAIALVADVRRAPAPVPPQGTIVLAIHDGEPPAFATISILGRDVESALARGVVEAALRGASRQAIAREREVVAGLVDLVTHDLRNPLAAVRANLGMLGTGGLDPDLAEAIDDSMMAADGALRIVDNFALAASLEAGRKLPLRGATDGRTGVLEAVRRVRHASEASSIPVLFEVPGDSVPCAVAPQTFAVLLDNLLGVALRYAPRGSDVRVRLERVPHGARVVVSEAASPVPEETARRLFDRAFQSDSKRIAAGRYGRGLGLYVVGLLAAACGATVACVPEAGRNTYRLDIPIDETAAE